MKLNELLQGIKVLKSNVIFQMEIKGIASDSRKVKNNYVFAAIAGNKRNGNNYICDAFNNGACVIVTDDERSYTDSGDYILVENIRDTLAKMWSNFYGNPSDNIKTVAITGTNGKTSSAYYLYNILKAAKKKRGLISTIECLINDEKIEINGGGAVVDIFSAMTTPDPEVLYYLYNEMNKAGVEYVVMEASSHALSQYRLSGLNIDIAAFTNLSKEHLDYHNTMEEYFKAKETLFINSKFNVINVDDEYGRRLYNNHITKSFGFSIKEHADYCTEYINSNKEGSEYTIIHDKTETLKIKTVLAGEYNVYNSLLAVTCAKVLGIGEEKIYNGILNTKNITGRLEKYRNKNIYIDYAHTPFATESVLRCIKAMLPGKKLIVLFGCGGDRDKEKRHEMGKICSLYADIIVVTSDNPRSEKPTDIIKDILTGVDKDFIVISNRKEAIKYSASKLSEDDVLILLGKGHEEYEIGKNEKAFFSEKRILDEVFGFDK